MLLGAASIVPQTAWAVPDGFAEDVDALLAATVDAAGPGVAVVVTEEGRVAYRGARGLADMAQNRPITPDTVFRMGSITKQFAAALVLQLADEGKLSLDDPLSRFVAAFVIQMPLAGGER